MDAARWLEAGEPTIRFSLGGKRGVSLLLLVASVAAWTNHQAAVFLILAVLGVAALARGWAAWSLRHLSVEQTIQQNRAFPGERIRFRVTVENEKLLPLTWLRVRAALPPALTPPSAPRRWPYVDRGGYVQGLTAVGGHTSVSWDFDLHCRRRGVYQVGPLEVSSGDPFGFEVRRQIEPGTREVMVYPSIMPLRNLGFQLSSLYGASPRQKMLQEDPSRASGVRAYAHGDPLRRMHWKATARHDALLVRTYEQAATPRLLMVLAADTFNFPWTRYREDLFEIAVSSVASIAWRALADGWPVGLLISGSDPVTLPPSSSSRQLTSILDALAVVRPSTETTVSDLLATHASLVQNAATILTVGRATIPLSVALQRLGTVRSRVVLLYGDDPPPSARNLPRYRLAQWADFARTIEGRGEAVNDS